MPEEDDIREIRKEVERIKDELSDIRHIQALQLRSSSDAKPTILKFFEGTAGKTRAQIYLAADGTKGVAEIAEAVGLHHSPVSRHGQRMFELGILGWESVGGRKVFHKTVVERALRISKDLQSIADGP